ncbi:alpha-D-ribose 1-methylphosphonate 5-triphosphate synthase subunit PhnH [Angulomicrobium tetraedrale]|uniref:Alpha-D-ribose 1-methylphosphonate 5-triphosphate synthase subunit PhnH n=1 Tax=Ancylobacter tetraedralis TaxID=217068 RepID=A0A839ZAM6_9HYPH|nr:hypothetical protein [Ancylobacter tetraedralis]MBB3771776.1 alpha-D-ribose 1-methylphosphonate 5-triphosphate synthase subunit PhnH [Ancylobacter tetraedralis]
MSRTTTLVIATAAFALGAFVLMQGMGRSSRHMAADPLPIVEADTGGITEGDAAGPAGIDEPDREPLDDPARFSYSRRVPAPWR